MNQILLKLADLNISNNYCGQYVIRLKGSYASYFKVINNALYLVKRIDAPGSYAAIISIEDPAGRFTPVIRNFTFVVSSCPQPPLTTAPPPPTT
jgi:hypothetical protein